MKKFLRKFIVASVAVGALTFASESHCLPIGTAVVHAEVKQYVGVGESIVSDRETPELGKEGARLQAIQNAQKQAGVFIGSLSVTKDSELDTDEVVAFTAGVVKVGTVKYEPVPVEQWMKYRATVVVTIDTDDLPNQINAWLKRNARDRSNIVVQNKDLQNLVDRQTKRVKDLERTITASKDTAKVRQEVSKLDNDTRIIQKTADGNQAYFNGDYSTAAKNYSDVLKLKEFDVEGTGIYHNGSDASRNAVLARRAALIDAWRKLAEPLRDYVESRSPGKLEADEQFRYKVNDIIRRSIITYEKFNDDGSYSVKMKLRPEDVDKLQTYFER